CAYPPPNATGTGGTRTTDAGATLGSRVPRARRTVTVRDTVIAKEMARASVRQAGNGLLQNTNVCGTVPARQWGACRNGQCECYEGYKGDDCSQYDPNIMMNKDVSIGMNIGGISYYSSEVKWVDVAKQSQEWITEREGGHEWDTHEHDSVSWRPDGYPERLEPGLKLLKLMLRDFGAHEESGNYTILYEGEGDIEFSLTEHHTMYEGKGRMVINFPNIGSGGILMVMTATNPDNPIRNIRVLPPGYENTYERFPFHPLFLEFLKRYSELRFMDYLNTNNHKPEPTTWDSRMTPDFHTHEGGGSIEYLVQLANTVGADPWVCMPHAADDNYVRQFATYVKNKLRPDLNVYVEYSNEVWNGIFRQTHYTQEQGKPLFPDDPTFKQGMKYFNKRATEVANIWTQVWGSDKNRITNVYAWQTGFQDYYRQALEDLGDRKSSFQALGITGYFDCDQAAGKNHATELPSMSMTQIQQLCDNDLPDVKASFSHYMDVAKAHGLKLVMYEGGPSVMENGAIVNGAHVQEVTDKAIAFNKDPAIEKPVQDVLKAWEDIVASDASNSPPGGLFNYFSSTGTPSKYGSWGMAEYTGQDLSQVPKWLAVQTFISQHWPNNPLGPKCSFVKDPATDTAYGCFKSGQHYVCAKSADDGQSWTVFVFNNLPSLHQGNTDHVTLDGFDPDAKKLYVRVTDTTDVNTYHVYSETSHRWTTMQNFQYFSEEYSPAVLPRFSNGVYHGLDANAKNSQKGGLGVFSTHWISFKHEDVLDSSGSESGTGQVNSHNHCKCLDGFTGTNCETDCGCEGHGVCKSDGTCECEEGWKWSASHHKCVWDCNGCASGVSCIGPGECGCQHDCKWGACRNGQCECYEGYKGDDCLHYDANIMMNKDVTVGINLGGITYYSSEVKWVDVAKQSQEWITQRQGVSQWSTGEHDKITWRDDGYPASLEPDLHVVKLMLRDFGMHEEKGNYTILYDGDGFLDFGLTSHHVHHNGKGRMVVDFPNIGHSGILLKVLATNPHNPIHNIRVLPPGYENTYERFPFHPLFLEFLKRFSEIRFMDYLHTNGHGPEPTTWSTRRLPDFHTQAGEEGGAIEYLVQLANTLGVDPWICVPHAADDNCIRKLATYVKNKLRPDRKVYVEYSNEVWNNLFRQAKYTQEQGHPLYPGHAAFKQGMMYHNQRATEIADMWTQVWGSAKDRVVNVFAWQTGFRDYYRQALDDLGDRKSSFQAMAITGYFGCDQAAGEKHAAELPGMTMEEIQHLCDIDLPNKREQFTHYMDVAKAHGLKLVMYEGGPGIMEGGAIRNGAHVQAVTDKAIAFHQDSHIQRPVQDVLEAWYDIVTSNGSNASPGGLFNYFSSTGTPSKYGSWGMAQYTGQDLSQVPKWLGVQTFISQHWPNNPLGPKCSFVKDPTTDTAYGCFKSGQHYVCAKSADDGRSWANLPTLHQHNTDHVTLDGFDPTHKKLYVRVTDTTDVNTYHVYSEDSNHWTT
ncbi:hypothetical protein BaRGS_00013653, partial [Batillaria attramentaria]